MKFSALAPFLIAFLLLTAYVGVTVVFPDLLSPPSTLIGAPNWALVDYPGSSLVRSGDYLKVVGRYWVCSLSIDYDQALQGYVTDSLSLAPGDAALANQRLNSTAVETRKTVTILITPKQPYVTMDLKRESVAVAPSATGYNWTGSWTLADPNFAQVTSSPLTVTVLRPLQPQTYKIHIPFTITVKQGSTVLVTMDSEDVESFPPGAQVWTVSTAFGDIRINDLGNIQRDQTLPPLLSYLFFPYTSVQASRPPLVDALNKAYTVFASGYSNLFWQNPGSYANYWFAGTSSMTPVYNFIDLSDRTTDNWYGVGWLDYQMRGWISSQHVYAPLTPQVTLVAGAQEQQLNSFLTTSWWEVTKGRLGLLDWLPDYVSGLAPFTSFKILNPQANNPQFVGYLDPNSVYTKSVTFYIDSSVADTWVYSPLESNFSIYGLKLLDQNGNVYTGDPVAGRTYTLSVSVQNTGQVDSATANVYVSPLASSANPASFSIVSIPLGGVKTATTTIRTGATSGANVQDRITVQVFTTGGRKCDEKYVDLRWQPAQDTVVIGTFNLVPDPVPPRGTSQVHLGVTNIGGGSGTANVKVVFSVTGPFSIAPSTLTATIPAGNTMDLISTITSTQDAGSGTLTAVIYDANSGAELTRSPRTVNTGSGGPSSSDLKIVTYFFDPTAVDLGSAYKLYVKVKNSGLLPEQCSIVVSGSGTWLFGTVRNNILVLPAIGYETDFTSIAPLGMIPPATVTIALYDSNGANVDYKTANVPLTGNFSVVLLALGIVGVLLVVYPLVWWKPWVKK